MKTTQSKKTSVATEVCIHYHTFVVTVGKKDRFISKTPKRNGNSFDRIFIPLLCGDWIIWYCHFMERCHNGNE